MPRFLDFDSFRIDLRKRLLLHDGRPVSLKPKTFELLVVLAEQAGRVLEKRELMERLWPDTFVEEANLTQHISLVRKALGESSQERRYVVTVPGRGYQFVAEVEEVADEDENKQQTVPVLSKVTAGEMTRAREAAERPGENRTVAVLSDSRPATRRPRRIAQLLVAVIVSAGLTASLLYFWFAHKSASSAAAKQPIRSLAVLPFKQSGAGGGDEEYLGLGLADALITKFSGLKQITMRPTGEVLKYRKDGQDALAAGRALGVDAVLDGVVQKSGNRVRVTAQLLRTRDGELLWAQTFDEHWDDLFAVQDAMTGRIVDTLALNLTGEERQQLTKHQPLSADSYRLVLLAALLWRQEWNWAGSEALYRRAIEIDPDNVHAHHGYGIFLASQGRVHEGIRELRRTLELRPSHVNSVNVLGTLYIYARQYDDALAHKQQALKLAPQNASVLTGLGWAYLHKGMYKDAGVALKKANDLEDGKSSDVLALLGYVDASTGNRDRALAVLWQLRELQQQQQGRGWWGAMAVIHTALDEKEQALACLEKTIAAPEWWTSSLKVNPLFDNLRPDPRFADLLRRTGLEP